MRIAITGLIGAIVMFIWGAVAHMALPIGEMGIKLPAQQDAVLNALSQSAAGEGVYMYPSMAPEKWGDEAFRNGFIAENKDKAYAFVIYQPGGNPAIASMGPNLGKQFVSCLLGALLAAWVMALAARSFGRRVMIAGAMALFAWFALSVPYWNWYLYPIDFTLGALLEQVIGWLLAGSAMAWWLGRKEPATA
ncbi:MAG: hypothetical protein HOQ32_01285 [Lysobacter sp.]|nr:hypothetical protein [Lysobacter sp.]